MASISCSVIFIISCFRAEAETGGGGAHNQEMLQKVKNHLEFKPHAPPRLAVRLQKPLQNTPLQFGKAHSATRN